MLKNNWTIDVKFARRTKSKIWLPSVVVRRTSVSEVAEQDAAADEDRREQSPHFFQHAGEICSVRRWKRARKICEKSLFSDSDCRSPRNADASTTGNFDNFFARFVTTYVVCKLLSRSSDRDRAYICRVYPYPPHHTMMVISQVAKRLLTIPTFRLACTLIRWCLYKHPVCNTHNAHLHNFDPTLSEISPNYVIISLYTRAIVRAIYNFIWSWNRASFVLNFAKNISILLSLKKSVESNWIILDKNSAFSQFREEFLLDL